MSVRRVIADRVIFLWSGALSNGRCVCQSFVVVAGKSQTVRIMPVSAIRSGDEGVKLPETKVMIELVLALGPRRLPGNDFVEGCPLFLRVCTADFVSLFCSLLLVCPFRDTGLYVAGNNDHSTAGER